MWNCQYITDVTTCVACSRRYNAADVAAAAAAARRGLTLYERPFYFLTHWSQSTIGDFVVFAVPQGSDSFIHAVVIKDDRGPGIAIANTNSDHIFSGQVICRYHHAQYSEFPSLIRIIKSWLWVHSKSLKIRQIMWVCHCKYSSILYCCRVIWRRRISWPWNLG